MEEKLKILDEKITFYKNLKLSEFWSKKAEIINDYTEFADLLMTSKNVNHQLTAFNYFIKVHDLSFGKRNVKPRALACARFLLQNGVNCLDLLLQSFPDDIEVNLLAGNILRKANNLLLSTSYYKLAAHFTKDKHVKFNALFSIACNFVDTNQLELALAYCDELEKIDSANFHLHELLGTCYTKQKDIKKAIKHFDKAYKYTGNDEMRANILTNKGLVISFTRDFVKSEECYQRSLFYNPNNYYALQNMLLDYLYQDYSMKELYEKHCKINSFFVEKNKFEKPSEIKKIGVFSGDLSKHNHHPVLLFSEVFDNEMFYLFCNDTTEANQYPNAKVFNIAGMNDDQIIALAKKLEIDVAIDLSTNTNNNKLKLFGERVAPIQMQYLGYPVFSGLKSIDYYLTDSEVETVTTRELYGDKILCTSNCFLNYKKHDYPVNFKKSEIGNRYAIFNKITKFSDAFLKVLKKLLERDPKAILVFKNSELRNKENRDFIYSHFPFQRVEILNWSENHEKHCAEFDKCSIALDTMPYSGTTTTCDALCVGCPVITLKSNDKNYQNVSSSLLKHSGLSDFITTSDEEYVSKAIEVAETITQEQRVENKRCFDENICDIEKFRKEFVETIKSVIQKQ